MPTVRAPDIERATALAFLRDMLLVRRFEEKCAEEYSSGRIRGFLHLYIGEEAVAVGAIHALEPADAIFATYREHGHALVRGIGVGPVMAEMFGKREGCSGGRGGSMHLFSKAHRFFGGNAIVAGALPLAIGYALGEKMQKRTTVSACFFGDGAMAEGEFHEAMNLAALWRLPVLFICENNLYAMGTALARYQSQTDLCAKAASYKIAAEVVDGMDVLAVQQATKKALVAMRTTSEPYFLECQTYRFRAHSMFDSDLYRNRDEIEVWKRRDPIATFFNKASEFGLLTNDDLNHAEAEVDACLRAGIEFAEAGTLEPVSELSRYVYSEAPAGSGQGNGMSGGGARS